MFSPQTTFGAHAGAVGDTHITSDAFNVTAGDLILAAGRASTLAPFTIADDAGNTWTPIDTFSTASEKLQWWYAIASANWTANHVTVTVSTINVNFRAVVGAVYSDPHASPLDLHEPRVYSFATNSLQTATALTLTYADELVVGIGAPAALGLTYTPSGLVNVNRRIEDFLVLCDKIHTGTPAADFVTIGLSGSATALFMAATFRPGTSSGGSPQTVAAGIAVATWTATAGTVTPGNVTQAAGIATAAWQALGSTVSVGPVTVPAAVASASWVVLPAAATVQVGLPATPAVATWGVLPATVSAGGVVITSVGTAVATWHVLMAHAGVPLQPETYFLVPAVDREFDVATLDRWFEVHR